MNCCKNYTCDVYIQWNYIRNSDEAKGIVSPAVKKTLDINSILVDKLIECLGYLEADDAPKWFTDSIKRVLNEVADK